MGTCEHNSKTPIICNTQCTLQMSQKYETTIRLKFTTKVSPKIFLQAAWSHPGVQPRPRLHLIGGDWSSSKSGFPRFQVALLSSDHQIGKMLIMTLLTHQTASVQLLNHSGAQRRGNAFQFRWKSISNAKEINFNYKRNQFQLQEKSISIKREINFNYKENQFQLQKKSISNEKVLNISI